MLSLCVYYNLYVYTTITMCIPQSLCFYYNIYVYTTISVYTTITMCILQSLCLYYNLYGYSSLNHCCYPLQVHGKLLPPPQGLQPSRHVHKVNQSHPDRAIGQPLLQEWLRRQSLRRAVEVYQVKPVEGMTPKEYVSWGRLSGCVYTLRM